MTNHLRIINYGPLALGEICVRVIPGALSSRFSGLAESPLARSQEVAVVLSGMIQMTLSECVCVCVNTHGIAVLHHFFIHSRG